MYLKNSKKCIYKLHPNRKLRIFCVLRSYLFKARIRIFVPTSDAESGSYKESNSVI